jgi:diacylglycerol O-acyltransferase
MEQLGGIDAALMYLESERVSVHTGGVLIYDPGTAPGGRVTVEQILDRVQSRLGHARGLRQRVVRIPFDLDLPYWVDGNVEIEQHVQHDPLRPPGDWRQLCSQVASFLERPLDVRRPLWELSVIDGLEAIEGYPAGSFAIAMKLHHALVDGIGGLEVVAALHDRDAGADESPRTWDVENPGWLDLLRKPIQPSVRFGGGSVTICVPDVARRPLRLLGVLGGAGLRAGRRQLATTVEQDVKVALTVPETRFNGPLGRTRSVGGVSFAMDRVRAIRAKVPGVTVNDIALAVVGGALRRYLEEQGELPDAPLVSVMPMSVRTAAEQDAGGNLLALSTVALGTDHEDPVERLRAVHESARSGKAILQGPAARSVVDIADSVPGALLGMAGRIAAHLDLSSSRIRRVNTGVTNVPGPRQPMYLCGAELSAIYGYALVVPGLGLMHMASGMEQTLTLGFQAGQSMLPDPAHYEACLRWSFDELEAATCDA